MFGQSILCIFPYLFSLVSSNGLLLLYRPWDISNDCAFSHYLRYDLSFGMGMSDTITLVLRTLSEIDYECIVDITTDGDKSLLIVIRFPINVGTNCIANGDVFTVMKKNKCLRLCDLIGERDVNSPYFIVSVKNRLRFRFLSNSSINSEMNANLYQVTATSARKKPSVGCNFRNETVCVIGDDEFCFTSGVVCDGIKNCGVSDWFDERKSDCALPVERLGYAPVITVAAVVICAIVAVGHKLMQHLPPTTSSFFIFNANEDNRLCIDTIFMPPELNSKETLKVKRGSLIPISSSSSTSDSESLASIQMDEQSNILAQEMQTLNMLQKQKKRQRRTTMHTVKEKIQNRLRSVTVKEKSTERNRQVFQV
ncbi:uncharacterized protein LOC113517784 [Galleria mellonella]|uniref:Uncharacterized protein LOC113517784 n=1 Tax=Galleria mellonella TaxID=7137 RepID=A0A6J3C657_GALME|nr:uncharacterized protein LOC113517784 [Galleria mellonella]